MSRIASLVLMLAAFPLLTRADDSGVAQVTRYKVVEVTGEKGGQMAQRYSRVTTPEPGGAHFVRAIELYAQGPDAAKDIIAEADLEIAEFPDSISARLLKAKVLKGTNRCKEALAVLGDAERILDAHQEIAGSVKYLRAECLYHQGQYAESKQLLTAFAAFMKTSDGQSKRYDELLAKVEAGLATP
jgi:predicted Zn-dependent protease